ncbi:uncharacterized protein LOC129892883 [Solanum dulcamara]|uniref:uncharacterized protein LOC129892883 n=1 Tax=Solanum dulcamara TaxID=45834 RepID=UPI002485E68C|nr:uncharacterized protein LOC129892883 [Solanum dulcamara]
MQEICRCSGCRFYDNFDPKVELSNKKIAINTTTKLSNKYNTILLENMQESIQMRVMPSSECLYTVIDMIRQYIVCLKEGICTCKKYQIDELLCQHVCTVLKKKYVHREKCFSFYYTKEYMLKRYEVLVEPLSDESAWDIPKEILEEVVLPPKGKKCRKAEKEEGKKIYRNKEKAGKDFMCILWVTRA